MDQYIAGCGLYDPNDSLRQDIIALPLNSTLKEEAYTC